MLNVLINGANGKMGNEVEKAISKSDNLKVVCGVDVHTSIKKDFPVYSDIENISENVDVIIDFSIPKATLNILKFAKKNHTPIVIATTGFSEEDEKIIKEYSKEIPIFKSSNMSYDINLMAKLVQQIAKALDDSDIEIVETHHNRKIDSPSGTAILLADAINKALGNNKKTYNFNRMQERKSRNKSEIGFSSIRGGNIVGEHCVKFFGEDETLEIKHTAYSRQIFANGAIKAAMFITNQKNGLYDMKDL